MASPIVHHPVEPLSGRSRRTLAEQILVRVPALGRATTRLFYRLSPGSLVRRWYVKRVARFSMAALSRGDLDAAMIGCSENIVLVADPLAAGFQTEYQGHEGAGQLVADWEREFADLRWEPREVYDGGQSLLILAVQYGRGRESNAEVTLRFGITTLARGGLVHRVEYDLDWERALERISDR